MDKQAIKAMAPIRIGTITLKATCAGLSENCC